METDNNNAFYLAVDIFVEALMGKNPLIFSSWKGKISRWKEKFEEVRAGKIYRVIVKRAFE
jgi:hypothetical protein